MDDEWPTHAETKILPQCGPVFAEKKFFPPLVITLVEFAGPAFFSLRAKDLRETDGEEEEDMPRLPPRMEGRVLAPPSIEGIDSATLQKFQMGTFVRKPPNKKGVPLCCLGLA